MQDRFGLGRDDVGELQGVGDPFPVARDRLGGDAPPFGVVVDRHRLLRRRGAWASRQRVGGNQRACQRQRIRGKPAAGQQRLLCIRRHVCSFAMKVAPPYSMTMASGLVMRNGKRHLLALGSNASFCDSTAMRPRASLPRNGRPSGRPGNAKSALLLLCSHDARNVVRTAASARRRLRAHVPVHRWTRRHQAATPVDVRAVDRDGTFAERRRPKPRSRS